MNLNATIIGQAIAFAIFVWFCVKFVWPPITQALQDRQQRIADGLEFAKQSEEQLNEAKAAYIQQIDKGKAKAIEIVSQARVQADQIVVAARGKAEDEGDRIVDQAHDNVKRMHNEVRNELQQEISQLVLTGVEQILGKAVTAKIDRDLIAAVAKQLQ